MEITDREKGKRKGLLALNELYGTDGYKTSTQKCKLYVNWRTSTVLRFLRLFNKVKARR